MSRIKLIEHQHYPFGTTIGVLSDTHGSLPRAAMVALQGATCLIHAGDVVSESALSELGALAPLTAVRGNMDREGAARKLPKTATLELGGVLVHVLHNLMLFDLDPVAAGITVVIHGHTHLPEVAWKGGVLYLNPGSAVLPRGGHRPSVARLTIDDHIPRAEIIWLG